MRRFVLAGTLVLLFASCQHVSPPADERFLVKFTRSGGFVAIHQTLVVNDDGSMISTDRSTGKERHGTASAQQLGRLRELVESEEFKNLQPQNSPFPSDGIIYAIQVPGGKAISSHGAAPPTLSAVIRECEALWISIQ